MTGLLPRVPSGQQARCLVLRVCCGALSFGYDVTPLAYQVLIDRQAIVSMETVCHSRPTFMGIDREVWPLSGSVEPGSDPLTDQQIDDGRETVVEDNTQPLGVHRENALCPPGQQARCPPHEFYEQFPRFASSRNNRTPRPSRPAAMSAIVQMVMAVRRVVA